MFNKVFPIAIICSLLLSCNNNSKTQVKAYVAAANLDTTVKSSNDFFEYANGGWIKKNPIPADQNGWGIGYVVNEENQRRLKTISEEAAKNEGAKGSASQMIGDFWMAAMDTAAIEKEGTKRLQPWLDTINSIQTINSFMETITQLYDNGIGNLFEAGVGPDDKYSDLEAYKLWQGGLGLPDREYYFKTDSSTINIRNEYVRHITKILELSGTDTAKTKNIGTSILAFETKLAKVSRTREQLRDPYANYNKMAISDLSKKYPVMNWEKFLSATGVKYIDSVIVGQPEFFAALDGILKSTPVPVLKNYLRFHLLEHYADALPNAYGIENFNFNKLLSGAKERKPRWKRVVNSEQDAMGELLGQLYVKQYFNDSAKQRYIKMVEAIRDAYKERIQNLTWMSDSTKEKALIKLAAIKKKIGFPEKW
jgi:putative endopeptidase